jgi:hypothetical protein
LTASIFDELIFDDLFMYNCRCDLCQRARGNRSWTESRLDVMKEVAEKVFDYHLGLGRTPLRRLLLIILRP